MDKKQIDIIFKKKISPESYEHCQFCVNYQMFLRSIITDPNSIAPYLSPNCMWFIEHVLNGTELSSNTCPWYLDWRKELTVQ